MDADTRTLMEACCLCPRECGVNRFVETGYCGGGAAARVNLHRLHFWEEPVISGTGGSGTIFFSHCTMVCAYCQNHRISQEGRGTERSVPELAAMMLELQEAGAHNVNLVTASQFTPQAAEAIRLAHARGLRVPVLWNSNAYEKPETLRMLEGLVDVYLPDFRYIDSNAAEQYSDAPGYPDIAKAAILEMHRQVGHLALSNDIAQKGLIIRILVLPGLHNRCAPYSGGSKTPWEQRPGSASWASITRSTAPLNSRRSTGPSRRKNTRRASHIWTSSASRTTLSRKWGPVPITRRNSHDHEIEHI